MPSNEYMREYRQTDAGRAALHKQKQRQKAKNRAYATLGLRHKVEFESLFTMHLEAIEREEQDREVGSPGSVRDA